VPNPNAQASLIEEAVRRAGIDPRTISYVEAHGSGTELGDPIEVTGLAQAFRSLTRGSPGGPVARGAIGSVKSNIGHLEGAAGIAGLTKLLLQIRHRKLVPAVNLRSLNPKIDFAGAPFEPQRCLVEWSRPKLDLGDGERTYPRRAGVSSFGAGGANVHVVVEELERPAAAPGIAPAAEHLFLLSAPGRDRLAAHAAAVAAFLEAAPPELALADLAYTSQVGRRAFDDRVAVAAHDLAELASVLAAVSRGAPCEAAVAGTVGNETTPGESTGGEAAPGQLLERRDLRSLAHAWTRGVAVDWRRLWPAPGPRRVMFPTMPFNRKRYWITAPGLGEATPPASLEAPAPAPEAPREPSGGAVEGGTHLRYEHPVW